ncbi:deoxycytidylate deaminase [Pseudomonas aeruginosa]|nr:deoxycytidylate deaminase [Pseudomonas aeruginosa]HEJ2539261.1 deoxycytidylate deaminase [Pseudomonas aeruginosa]
MADAAVVQLPAQGKQGEEPDGAADKRGDLMQRIRSRQSKELVIGLAGAVGCNLKDVYSQLRRQFENFAYDVRLVKISDIIKDYYKTHPIPPQLSHIKAESLDALTSSARYKALQDLGNDIRSTIAPYALATQAIRTISLERERQLVANGQDEPPRTVYIVDQLKHPAEVALFKNVYRNVFYLIGVLSPEEARISQLKQEDMDAVAAQELVERDRNENDDCGQKLEKTIQHADFFIRHALGGIQSLTAPCERFVGLVHGKNGLTPTVDEAGMYAAYSASLKSACLSRQVGASIADSKGNIVSLGWNDVPKAGGGLYGADDGEGDQRCVHKGGKCQNDHHKNRLVEKVVSLIQKELKIDAETARGLSGKIMQHTPVGSLIEYSRAVHAEMEAILNLARKKSGTTSGATLYSTTYPCHNCARHIIAAGIMRVVYIEPYEKSLATTLHSDAVSKNKSDDHMVVFENFEGVSPKRYAAFFGGGSDRKDPHGTALHIVSREANLISTELLDSYIDVESKVVQLAVDEFGHPYGGQA